MSDLVDLNRAAPPLDVRRRRFVRLGPRGVCGERRTRCVRSRRRERSRDRRPVRRRRGSTWSEARRFPNRPVRLPDGLYWDVLGLFGEICSALGELAGGSDRVRSVGIDSWGCDFGLIDRARHPDLEPAPSSGRPRGRRDGEGVRAGPGRGDLRDDRHPVPAVQHVVPAARSRAERGPAIRGDLPPDPGPAGLLADRRALRRGDEREHDPAPRCRDRPLVGQPDLEARHPRAALRGRARARRGRRRPASPRRRQARACRPGRR